MVSIPINNSIIYTFKPYIPDQIMPMRIIEAVTNLMKQSFEISQLPEFHVLFDIRHGDPETFKEVREIYITALDICWGQIIYQYAHELCHLLIPDPIPERFKWFEESICALASIYFLYESADNWLVSFPDHPYYQEKIRTYISDVSVGEEFPLKELFNDQSEYSIYLKANRYDRNKNRYVALSLLPIFKNAPQIWKSIPLLCAGAEEETFKGFLHQWRNISGDESIDRIIQLFT